VKTRARPRLVLVVGRDAKARRAAAAGVAKQDGAELLRIDLQALVTKYLGETEKALAAVLARAEAAEAMIFFDEADALFGRGGEGAKTLRRALAERDGATLLGVKQLAASGEAAADEVIRAKAKPRREPKG
jgi:SpoVK/Ycf46/Vps4 family AAA+-type ATPase